MSRLHALFAFFTVFWTFAASAQTRTDITVGSLYDIVSEVELHDGPGQKYEKKVNQKGSETLHRITYLSVDQSTTVKVLSVKGDWVEIQLVEPTELADTHRGWIPASALKRGKATHKRDGWITQACSVYSAKDPKSKRVGFLRQGSAVNVVDDGSGWLEVSSWGMNPVMDMKSGELLDETQIKSPMFIERANFTQTPPGQR